MIANDRSIVDLSSCFDDVGVLAAYIAKPRRLVDWRDNPPVEPEEGVFDYSSLKMAYDDYTYLDGLCRKLCALPTIQAMVQTVPKICETDLYHGYREEFTWGGLYNTEQDEVDLNTSATIPKNCTVDHMLIAHAAHELRHGVQKHAGCFEYEDSAEYKQSISSQLAFSRALEADATCFSIAVGYEYSVYYGDDGVLRGLCGFSRSPSVMAYLKEIIKDPSSHNDGRAIQAAFDAYLSRANVPLLKKYDVEICKSFNGGGELTSRKAKTVSPLSLSHQFWECIHPICSMPYAGTTGEVIQRLSYQPTKDQSRLLKCVSREARQAARFDGLVFELDF